VQTSTSWGTGIQEQSIGFNIYTLRPWLSRVESSLSNELLPRGVNCRFNVSELLRGDMQKEIDAHQTAILSGQETPNEARAARGLPPITGGNQLYFPINYATLQNVANPPPQPSAAVAPQQANPGGQTDAANAGQ
jgi:phage portal protein BeeE